MKRIVSILVLGVMLATGSMALASTNSPSIDQLETVSKEKQNPYNPIWFGGAGG